MIKKTFSQSGFSLVEVLVAVSILLIVVVGQMGIIIRANNSTAFANEQITAFFLAQEGLELARKASADLQVDYFYRLANSMSTTTPWNNFVTAYPNCFGTNGACGLTVNDGATGNITVTNCTGGSATNCRLYERAPTSANRSRFVHTASGNTPTLFTRTINMERAPATGKIRDIKVTSTVTWRTGSLISSQQVELATYLFNVYDTE